jgi:hypothetical protein
MASPKIPWARLWACLWKMIPEPLTGDRLLLTLDDSTNPKTGKKIFGCARVFDHAAKQNQSKYPWAQNIVMVGLLKTVKGRWACLPLSYRFYHMKKTVEARGLKKPALEFKTKIDQAVEMVFSIAEIFQQGTILLITDSWFGNDSLYKPLNQGLARDFHLLSRLRCNNTLYDLPGTLARKGPGRPRKYGKKMGNAAFLALKYQFLAKEYNVTLYGRSRAVMNHLHFRMMAATLTRVYASRIEKTPIRRHAVTGRNHFAFSDVRRLIAEAALDDNFSRLFPKPRKTVINSLVSVLLRMAA